MSGSAIVGLVFEQVEYAPRGADRLLVRTKQLSERADCRCHEERVEEELDQRAARELVRQHEPAALPEHRRDSREARERDDAEEHAAHESAMNRRVHHNAQLGVIPLALGPLAREALHRANLTECLFGRAHRLGHAILHHSARFAHRAAKNERGAHHHRHHCQRRHRELRMCDREHHDAAHEVHQLSRELRRLVRQHALQQREIRAQSARELARALLSEESRRQSHQVREQLAPQFRDHPLGHRCEQPHLHEAEQPLHGEDDDEQDRELVEQRAVALHERGVEQLAHDQRERESDSGAK